MSPTYEFICDGCERTEWYVTTKYEATPLQCEQCDQPMRLVFNVPGVVLKGEGWASKEGKK